MFSTSTSFLQEVLAQLGFVFWFILLLWDQYHSVQVTNPGSNRTVLNPQLLYPCSTQQTFNIYKQGHKSLQFYQNSSKTCACSVDFLFIVRWAVFSSIPSSVPDLPSHQLFSMVQTIFLISIISAAVQASLQVKHIKLIHGTVWVLLRFFFPSLIILSNVLTSISSDLFFTWKSCSST